MKYLAAAILLLSLSILNAQDDDVFALTPFTIDESGGQGYMASSSLSGTRVNSYNSYNAAVSLRRKADSVTLSLTLRNNNRNALERNEELMDTVYGMIDAAEDTDGIRAHNGNISLSTRNRKVSIFSSSNEASQVQIFILGDLMDGEDVYKKTAELKTFLESVSSIGETKMEEGNIGLSVKNPQSYRPEILQLVLIDINSIKTILGGNVRMNINGLDGRVVVKQANESEVDLLIPYSFSLNHSVKKDAS
ncbi:hypothetical protein N9X40_02810 [bacterium]|jgi:hypothetical protein|nr:hypothetical protein [Opitutales bacterium]MDB2499766.1 hypothetical protein [bacterium]